MILVDNLSFKAPLLAGLFLIFFSCSFQKKEEFIFTGRTMGTAYSVKVISSPHSIKKEELEKKIKKTLKDINMEMSTYMESSEISRFNRSKANIWFDISPNFWKVMKYSFEMSRETKGVFDVTIGPLVNLWGFGPEKDKILTIPPKKEIEKRKAFVGMNYLEIRREPRYQIKKSKKETFIDLSAIAKGYGVDEVGRLLESLGYESYLVEIGGDLRTRGSHMDRAWRIGMERVQVGRGSLERVLLLKDMSVASSGDYRNYHEIEGKKFSHMIDPRTARPIGHKLASVSVLHRDCIVADAWATALLVLGEKKGYALAVEKGIAAIFTLRKGEGFQVRESPSFQNYMKKYGKEEKTN